ncbi:MAG: class I SAM-dependent methyltransferase [Planctomycetota bacterium]
MRAVEFWDRYLRGYDALNTLGDYRAYLDELVERLELRPGMTVLDAGSGTGNLSVLLERRGARAVGLDFSPEALSIHRRKSAAAPLLRASLEEELPFCEGTFDRVVCASVLFSLSEDGVRTALREFARVLRPGGLLLATAMRPGQSKLAVFARHLRERAAGGSLLRLLGGGLATAGSLLRVYYHNCLMYGMRRRGRYRRFSRGHLVGAVRSAGFDRVEWTPTFGGTFQLVAGRKAQVPAGSAAGRVKACACCP